MKFFVFGLWISVIAECGIGPDKDGVLDRDPVPQIDARLDRDMIPHLHIIFYKAMGTDIAVFPDDRTGQDHCKLPDVCIFADLF